jgi:uncharacterized protein (TIRG00374 family)
MTASALTAEGKSSDVCRRQLPTAISLLTATVVIFGLLYYGIITVESLREAFRDPTVAVCAFLTLVVAYVLSAVRWYLILRAMGIFIRPRPCAEIFAMGMFANTVLPGGAGGDLLRAIYLARHLHQDRTGGVISVLADRTVGLFGVVTVASFLTLVGPEHMVSSPLTRVVLEVLRIFFCVVVLSAAVGFILLGAGRFERIKGALGSRTIVQRTIVRLFETVVQLRSSPVELLLSVLISVLITCFIAAAIALLAHGYGAGGLQPPDFASAGILALLSSSLPITPGGIGVGEGAFAFLCYAWETVRTALPYGTIFFGYRLILTVIAACGGIAFASYRGAIR